VSVDDRTQREHHGLLAASMAREAERRAACAAAPGTGLLLDSQVRPEQQGLGFGEGWRPPPHSPPVPKPMAGPLAGGVMAAGAAVVVPGARPPACRSW
jgi:hypothetical protein